jgi:CheY-like chemotaxis protein
MRSEDNSRSHSNVLRQKRCLIVDDDKIYCKLAASAIHRAMGHAVICNDGVEALEYLERKPVDIAIIDLLMPKIDGFRLIALMRHMPATKSLPIVVVTSQTNDVVRREAHRMDIAAFLTKPVDWATFPSMLRNALAEPESPSRISTSA